MISDRELIEQAKKAREYAYAPYSKFSVGAALLTENGKVFLGCNIENSSFGLSICAERVALFKAISSGEKVFLKLAVVGSQNTKILPCGACRQVLFEFAPDLIIVSLNHDKVRYCSLKELLPEGFSLRKEK